MPPGPHPTRKLLPIDSPASMTTPSAPSTTDDLSSSRENLRGRTGGALTPASAVADPNISTEAALAIAVAAASAVPASSSGHAEEGLRKLVREATAPTPEETNDGLASLVCFGATTLAGSLAGLGSSSTLPKKLACITCTRLASRPRDAAHGCVLGATDPATEEGLDPRARNALARGVDSRSCRRGV